MYKLYINNVILMSKAINQNQQLNYKEMALQGATESVREIYAIIQEYQPLSVNLILSETKYSSRTVRYALKVLLNFQIIEKVPNLTDLRTHYYKIKNNNFL